MLGLDLAGWLVRYLALKNASAALLYDASTGKVDAWAVGTPGAGFALDTPAINLQRAYGRMGKMTGKYILLSDIPTEACVGMAVLTGIKTLVHFDGKAFKEYKPGNQLTAGVAFKIPPVAARSEAITAWMLACKVPLESNVGAGASFLAEFDKVPMADPLGSQINAFSVLAPSTIDSFIPPASPITPEPLSIKGPEVDAFWMTVARRLIGLVHLGAIKVGTSPAGHNIGCVLVDANNKILAWGVNTLNNNPTYHAETKCMWMFQYHNPGQEVPAGATLYTTLQSCLMCSATIKRACGDNLVKVVYADADKVKNSPLTRAGGATEVALSERLQHHQHLESGQHLLAAARLDRLRRAFHQRLDLATKGPVPAGSNGPEHVAEFLTNMSTRSRERIEQEAKAVKERPMPLFYQAVLKLLELRLTAQGKHAQIGAARRAINEIADRPKIPVLQALEAERQDKLKIENAASKMEYSGGAPKLLPNPILKDRFYQSIEIRRPLNQDPSPHSAVGWNKQRILDLNTQLHALDLLSDVLARRDEYNLH